MNEHSKNPKILAAGLAGYASLMMAADSPALTVVAVAEQVVVVKTEVNVKSDTNPLSPIRSKQWGA